MVVVASIRRDELTPGAHVVASGSVIVWVNENGDVRATRNRCGHQGAKFGSASGCILTCSHHGWQLDLSKMVYINPTSGQVQPELKVEWTSDDTLNVVEEEVDLPWASSQTAGLLYPGELTIRFLAHACAQFTMGDFALITDPWLVGPAFLRGWWLAHQPTADWMDRLVHSDAIYISHNHSDHLNSATLGLLAERTVDVRFIVPPFADVIKRLEYFGFNNIDVVPFKSWVSCGEEGRLMVLRDGTTRNDSGLFLEYKGHRILNTVDCSDLNGGTLPDNVDVLLTSFAGGASGFPICWGDLYSEEEISKVVRLNRDRVLRKAVMTTQLTKARIVVPFAGYFTEAHPADADIKRINVKNTPEAAVEAIENQTTSRGWIPTPNSVFDLSTEEVIGAEIVSEALNYDFERWLAPIATSLAFTPLQSQQGILRYFEWSGFQGDLILDIFETSEDFETVNRRTTIDLRGPVLIDGEPDTSIRYERMRVRSDVFRYVLQHGLPWEEITIGFNARFTRKPDIYNMDFWSHMQDSLPSGSAWVEN
jgi:CMP-N-acetylneuraminate monooxygenase